MMTQVQRYKVLMAFLPPAAPDVPGPEQQTGEREKLKKHLERITRRRTRLEKSLAQITENLRYSMRGVRVIEDAQAGVFIKKIAALILAAAGENGVPSLAPLPLNPVLCAWVNERSGEINEMVRHSLLDIQQQILRRACNSRKYSLSGKQHALDTVLKVLEIMKLEPALPDDVSRNIDLTLGETYYRRACFIQPRGFSYPSKKKEALIKGRECLDPHCKTSPEARRLRALVHLELVDMNEQQDDFGTVLEKAAEDGFDLSKGPEDIQLALAYAEFLYHKKEQQTQIDNLLEPLLDPSSTPAAQTIDRACAAYLCNWLDDDLNGYLQAAIEAIEKQAFSRSDWDQVRRLLVNLYEKRDAFPAWSDLAWEAWQVCSKKERATGTSHAIRWYWSRQGDIYNLAFLAKDGEPDKQAMVIDSLKGRPALHLQTGGPKMIEQDAALRANRFITGSMAQGDLPEEIPWLEAPEPWIAVHLYLDQEGLSGKRHGHALWDTEGNRCWKHKPFTLDALWQYYWSWQENYQLSGRSAAPFLEKLCLQIGGDMPFLFDKTLFPPEKPVVFIPHDFLHRLPLHAAMRDYDNNNPEEQRQVWGKDRVFSYLPAWWMYKPETSAGSGPIVALDNWDNDMFVSIGKNIKSSASVNIFKRPAKGSDLAELSVQPAKLFCFCHGKAHMENPYQARLKLAEGGTSHQEIRAAEKTLNLAGAKVMLGACETDLAPPLSSTVDEHLSLASAFLDRGAVEVVSTMWEVRSDKVKELAGKLLGEQGPWTYVLRTWLKGKIQNYQDSYIENGTCDEEMLYDYIGFRPYGLPKNIIDEEE